MKGTGSAKGVGLLEMAWSLVALRIFCSEASELHTSLPTLWSEGENMEWAKGKDTEAREPEGQSEKLNAENCGPLPEIAAELVGGGALQPPPVAAACRV